MLEIHMKWSIDEEKWDVIVEHMSKNESEREKVWQTHAIF